MMMEKFLKSKKKVEELLGNPNGDVERLTVDSGVYRLDGLDDDIINSIKQHVHSLPIDCTALSYLTVFGSQICNYVQIDGNNTLCGLHSVAVTISGGGKTTNNKKLIDMMRKFAKHERRIHKRRMSEYNEKVKQWEEDKKNGIKARKPKEPREITVLATGGGNTQGLKSQLAHNTMHDIHRSFLMYDTETSAHWEGLAKYSKSSISTELAIQTGLLDFDYRDDLQVENSYIIDDVKWGYLGEIQAKRLYRIFQKIGEALEQGAFSRYLFWIGNGNTKIKHSYDRVNTRISKNIETFEDKLLHTLYKAPRVELILKNDGARELYDAFTDYIEDFKDMMENKNKNAELFYKSFILHSSRIVLSVAGIVHTINNAAIFMRDDDEDKDIKEECRWDNDITKEELSFAIRFVHHYQYLMIRFIESNGGNDGFECKDPITKNIKRLVRFINNQAKDPKKRKELKDDLYSFNRTTLNRYIKIKDKTVQEQIIERMLQEQIAEDVDGNNKKFTLTNYGKDFV